MKEGEVDLKSITEEAKIENIAVITDFVNSILEANGCSAKVQMEIDIAIDEIFGNIAYYAYTPKTGEATVQVEIKNFPERLELTFIDKGIPYNPLENKDPDVTGRIMVQTIILLAISFPMATLDSLTFTIRLPLISETTVTTPPTTKPSSSRCLFTSSLPPILLIVKGSPAFTIDNGISSSLPLHLINDKHYLYHVVSVF